MSSTGPKNAADVSILVIDDNEDILTLVDKYLKSEGFEVTTALGGTTALASLQEKQFDLIICDVSMPGKSGFDLVEIIKKDNKLKDIAVVFLTARNTKEDVVRASAVGGRDYIIKPFTKDSLLKKIKKQLILKLRDSKF